MKRIISLALSLIMMFSLYIPVNAVNNDKLEIKFQVGSTKIFVNGKEFATVKPFMANNSVFVPLIRIMEAYGAEINSKGKGKINLVYREVNLDLAVGSKNYTVNEEVKPLVSAPVKINDVIMVPAQFITENFGGKLTSDKNKKSYVITLEDDGAISDFSTVIGSIGKPKLGNSYFGWSINIPKGSQIVSTSFSSKSVTVENTMNELTIDVEVSKDKGKKLEELAKEIKDKKDDVDSVFYGKVTDVYVNTSTNPQCVEVLGNIYGKGAAVQRIIVDEGYAYKFSVAAAAETNPQKLKSKSLFMNVLNSFKLGYKGSVKDVYDISRVKSNNMALFTDTTYGFSMDVFPEWDIIKDFSYTNIYDPYSLRVGESNGEYISISPRNVGKIEDMDKYMDEVKAGYDSIYNPEYYSFLGKQTVELANMKVYRLAYTLQYKDTKYVIEDNFILQGNVLFDLVLKCTEDIYNTGRQRFDKIFETIRYTAKYSEEELKKTLSSRESNKAFNRVGSDNALTDYEIKENKWKIKIPGYWMTIPDYADISTIFYNENTQSYITIEAVKNNSANKSLDDEVKFQSLASSAEDEENTSFKDKKTLSIKGTSVRQYIYRYESDYDELYSDVCYYVIDNGDYSYCFMYMIPDVYASDKNIKEIEDVWTSLTFSK